MVIKILQNYGVFRIKGKDYKAHRVSYCIFHNIPNTPFDVLHECNNSSCVNPHHLKLGDDYDNAQDRRKIGGYNHMKNNTLGAKLTEEIVIKIRQEYSQGNINQYQLAEKYNVDQALISHIVNRKIWRHI